MRLAFTGKREHGKTTCAEFTGITTCLHHTTAMRSALYTGLRSVGLIADHEDLFGKMKHPLIARIYQLLGEYERAKDPDIFVKVLCNQIDKAYVENGSLAVDDVRFPNEANALRARGFVIVRVVRPGYISSDGRDPNHITETEMDLIEPDYTIINDGDLRKLRSEVEYVVSAIEVRGK